MQHPDRLMHDQMVKLLEVMRKHPKLSVIELDEVSSKHYLAMHSLSPLHASSLGGLPPCPH
jgi:hypothetical protein